MAEKTGPGGKCPICDKPVVARYRPFCSKRCADVDLHRWLGGNYRIPTDDEAGAGEGEESPDLGDRHD